MPLPGGHIINVSTETTLREVLRVGDVIRWTDEIIDVSPEKTTRLGRGHFITTRTHYANGDGMPVASNTNVLLRYRKAAVPGDDAPAAMVPADLDLPPVALPVSYRRVVHNAAATWDWFPGHHDPEYARAQGQRTIYLSITVDANRH